MITKTRFSILDPIFSQRIHVFCNSSEADLKKWQKRIDVADGDNEGLNPNYTAFSTSYPSSDAPTVYLIWLNHFDWTLDDQESLIHEITHIVVRIWEANNIKFIPETQEFFAHSVGRLYALIGTKLMAKGNKTSL